MNIGVICQIFLWEQNTKRNIVIIKVMFLGLVMILIGLTYGLMPHAGQSMGWTGPWVRRHQAILIDALLVRTILVPGVMHLIGKSNWWIPRWLDKILPRLSVEGPEDAEAPLPPPPRTPAPV